MIDTTYNYDNPVSEEDDLTRREQGEENDTEFEGEQSHEQDRQYDVGAFPEKRKRSSRACDQCRKTKSKCQQAPGTVTCRNCLSMNQECTFLGPSRKRGPPKGYINQLEHRISRLEALLGSLLATHDSRAQTLIADLAMDPLGRDILQDVDASPFGPAGRVKVMQSHWEEHMEGAVGLGGVIAQADTAGSLGAQGIQTQKLLAGGGEKGFISSRDRREQLILGNEADPSLPSYTWQDRMINYLNARGLTRMQARAGSSHTDDVSTAATTPIIPSAPYSFFDAETPPSHHVPLPNTQTQKATARQQHPQDLSPSNSQHQYHPPQQTDPSYPYSSMNGNNPRLYNQNNEGFPFSYKPSNHTQPKNLTLPIIDVKPRLESDLVLRTLYDRGYYPEENGYGHRGFREGWEGTEKLERAYMSFRSAK